MGVLKDMIEQLRHKPIEEESSDIEKNAKAGQDDADKIAKRMGQDKTSFVQHVDVTPPVEMPIETEQEHSRDDDGSR